MQILGTRENQPPTPPDAKKLYFLANPTLSEGHGITMEVPYHTHLSLYQKMSFK